jgi:hypothetical protein
MAFNWPAKKDNPPEPRSKREYPADLDPGIPSAIGANDMPGAEEKKPPPRPKQAAPLAADPLEDLPEQLNQLGQLVDETRERLAEYAVRADLSNKLDALCEKLNRLGDGGASGVEQMLERIYGKLVALADSPTRAAPVGGGEGAPAVSDAGLRPLAEKLDQVDAKCKSLADKATLEEFKNGFIGALAKVRDGLTEQHTQLGVGIRQIHDGTAQYFNAIPQYFTAVQQQVAAAQQQIAAGIHEVINILRPPQPEPTSGPVVSGDWQQAILGPELASLPALDFQRRQFFSGVLSGEPAACSLAGQLLVFRSAPVEKMPALLKDIGEAFYRWQPRTTSRPNEMERALVGWLQRTCAEAGVPNTIELVNPGERFDASRHNASERGVEITQVLGWIVLRDNGKVYTKASVAVK